MSPVREGEETPWEHRGVRDLVSLGVVRTCRRRFGLDVEARLGSQMAEVGAGRSRQDGE